MLLKALKIVAKSLSPIIHCVFIAMLTMLLFLSLAIFSSFNSLYNFYNELVLGGREGIVISSYAISPLTSIISESSVRSFLRNNTDISIEFTVFSIVYVKDRAVVVRGVDEALLYSVDSQSLELGDSCIFVGKRLAKKLQVGKGDILYLYSPFIKKSFLAIVCNVIDFQSQLDDEIVTGYELARVFRGIGQGYYSVAVVHTRDLDVLRYILEQLGLKPSDAPLVRRALLILMSYGGNLSYGIDRDFAEIYIARLGIHREFAVVMVYTIAILVVLGMPLIGEAIPRVFKNSFLILKQIGVSHRLIIAMLIALLLIYMALATALAMLCLHSFSNLVKLEVLSHELYLNLYPLDIFVTFSLCTFLTCIGALMGFKDIEKL